MDAAHHHLPSAAAASLLPSPLIQALRNAFLHLKDTEFESEVIIERQRRQMRALLSSKLKKKKNNNNNNHNRKSNSLAKVALPLAARTGAAAPGATTADCDPPASPLRFPLEPTLEMLSPEDDDDDDDHDHGGVVVKVGAGTVVTSPQFRSNKKKRAASSQDGTKNTNVKSNKKHKSAATASSSSAVTATPSNLATPTATAMVAAAAGARPSTTSLQRPQQAATAVTTTATKTTAMADVPADVAAAYESMRHHNFFEQTFNTYFAQLQAFQNKYGHLNVTRRGGGDDDETSYAALHAWLLRQQAAWRKTMRGGAASSKGGLSQERIARFMALGMEPPVLYDKGPAAASVKNSVDENQQPMASSAAATRTNPLKGCKTQQQQALWDMHYSSLLAFRKANGHANVPSKDISFRTLYNWLTIQRVEWRKVVRGESSSLSEVHIQKLISAGLVPTNPRAVNEFVNWEQRRQEWIDFKRIHGHLRVSDHTHGENFKKLAGWVRQQIINYRNMQHVAATGKKKDPQGGIMTTQQWELIKLIEGGEEMITLPRGQKLTFEDRMTQLTEYYSVNGNTNVPLDYTRQQHLGPFLGRMKKEYHKGKLSQKKIAAIEAIQGGSFVWASRRSADAAPEPRDAVAEELDI